jgi:hypothetical protein
MKAARMLQASVEVSLNALPDGVNNMPAGMRQVRTQPPQASSPHPGAIKAHSSNNVKHTLTVNRCHNT